MTTYDRLMDQMENVEAHNRVLLKGMEDLRGQLMEMETSLNLARSQRDEAIEIAKAFRNLLLAERGLPDLPWPTSKIRLDIPDRSR